MKNLEKMHKYIIAADEVENITPNKNFDFTAIVFLSKPSEVRAIARAKAQFTDLKNSKPGELVAYEYNSKMGQKILKKGIADTNSEIDDETKHVTIESTLLKYVSFDDIFRKRMEKKRLKMKGVVVEKASPIKAIEKSSDNNQAVLALIAQLTAMLDNKTTPVKKSKKTA